MHDPSLAESVVSITNLSRRFGSKTALNNLSLQVPRGSVFGLVGENGAGKSTLIKHILGLVCSAPARSASPKSCLFRTR